LLGRLALTLIAVVSAAVLGGLGVWAGAGSQGLHQNAWRLVGAGLNVVPTALVSLGIGAVVLALAPRVAGPCVYVVVAWSVFVNLLTPFAAALRPLQNVSLFHYMALAPGRAVDPTTVITTCVVGMALCALGGLLLQRRDLRTA
jgi:ABC-2 type transport system permease protein